MASDHSCSLVWHIKHLLSLFHTASCDLELSLVERLGRVEPVSVRSSEHVSVEISFSLPGGSVPFLTVTLVARSASGRCLGHLELGWRVVKDAWGGATTPDWFVLSGGLEEASSWSGGVIVVWSLVCSSVKHGSATISAASHFHGEVLLGDQFGVESAIITVRLDLVLTL